MRIPQELKERAKSLQVINQETPAASPPPLSPRTHSETKSHHHRRTSGKDSVVSEQKAPRPAPMNVHKVGGGRSTRDRDEDSGRDSGENFPQFCMTCEKQFLPANDTFLYCSEACRLHDLNPVPSHASSYSASSYAPTFYTRSFSSLPISIPDDGPDIIPRFSLISNQALHQSSSRPKTSLPKAAPASISGSAAAPPADVSGPSPTPKESIKASPTLSSASRTDSAPVIATTTPSKTKKVHYTSSTKGRLDKKDNTHRSNYDSGIGSSSASDPADIGSLDTHPFNSQEMQLQLQRRGPGALSEALDAANDTIRASQEANERLKTLLKESNREKRDLKEEKAQLIIEIENLSQELDQEKRAHERLRREVSGEGSPPPPQRRNNERSSDSSYRSRRYMVPPRVTANPFIPRPPLMISPNPFAPPSTPVVYATASAATYSPAPIPREGSRISGSADTVDHEHAQRHYNDGTYHPSPL